MKYKASNDDVESQPRKRESLDVHHYKVHRTKNSFSRHMEHLRGDIRENDFPICWNFIDVINPQITGTSAEV